MTFKQVTFRSKVVFRNWFSFLWTFKIVKSYSNKSVHKVHSILTEFTSQDANGKGACMLTPWPHPEGRGRAGQPGNRKQNDRQRSLPEHLRERGVAVIRPIGQNSSWVRGRWEESVEDREGGGGAFQEAGGSRGWGWSKGGGVSRKVMQSSSGGVTGTRLNVNRKSPLQTWALIHI